MPIRRYTCVEARTSKHGRRTGYVTDSRGKYLKVRLPSIDASVRRSKSRGKVRPIPCSGKMRSRAASKKRRSA